MKKILIASLIMCLVIGGGIYMVKEQQIRNERNMAIKNIQEKVSAYIIENYVGIKKIEWLGWEVSTLSNIHTAMVVNDYPLNENYEGLFSYSASGERHIVKYTDAQFEVTPFAEDNETIDLMQKEFRKQGVKKDHKGSPNAEIIYNWEEDK